MLLYLMLLNAINTAFNEIGAVLAGNKEDTSSYPSVLEAVAATHTNYGQVARNLLRIYGVDGIAKERSSGSFLLHLVQQVSDVTAAIVASLTQSESSPLSPQEELLLKIVQQIWGKIHQTEETWNSKKDIDLQAAQNALAEAFALWQEGFEPLAEVANQAPYTLAATLGIVWD